MNLFRFITNPNDFAQSVENLFYLSFLIRDGECALEIEEDGEPVICTSRRFDVKLFLRTSDPLLSNPVICEQPQLSDYQEGLKKQQLVFEFDIPTWEVSARPFYLQKPFRAQRLVRLGRDQSVRYQRSYHPPTSKSSQYKREVVWVTSPLSCFMSVVYCTDLIPSTLSNSAVFYTTNYPIPVNIIYSDLLLRVEAIKLKRQCPFIGGIPYSTMKSSYQVNTGHKRSAMQI